VERARSFADVLAVWRGQYDTAMTEKPSSEPGAPPPVPQQPATPDDAAQSAAGKLLRGTPVTPGLALGQVHLKDYELSRASLQRVPLDQVERELNRFHQALVDARAQLSDLKSRLQGKVPADDARILDTHVAYLKDSVFISDVENLILNEQLSLEAAIGKVISDFDRIFRLVQSDTLRERAVDLRDVGIRVLRHLERQTLLGGETAASAPVAPVDYVLVARELSIVDMFNLQGDHVLGILTEEGGLTSHAAILARSMRIPTLTGVQGLLDTVREGDFVIVDAAEGVVRVNPDELVRDQYRQVSSEARVAPPQEEQPAWAMRAPRTLDGERLRVAASCGNLPEVHQAMSLGMSSVGLYRTELMYLVDKSQPSRDTLIQHYASVVAEAQGNPVTFRLLHVDSSLQLAYLHDNREANPALGRGGVRALLSREQVLRRQLQAILVGSAGARVRIAIPFVTDCGDLRRVKEILFEERLELKKTQQRFQDKVDLGVVIETPAAMLGARDLASEADFAILSLDSLVQHLLAADRENHELRAYFENLHPYVLRAVRKVCDVFGEAEKSLSVFGVTAVQPHNLPFLIGVGVREFCVAPLQLREFLNEIEQLDSRSARRAAQRAAEGSCQAETLSLVDGYRHGYARP
jgi:phosphoenolpyruvate-protein phosphotransferase (PTS system enzyme I)